MQQRTIRIWCRLLTYPARRAPPWWWTCNRRRQSRFDSPPALLWDCPGMRPIGAPDPGSAHRTPESIQFWSTIRARALKSMRAKGSDANPDPWSGAFLTPGSGIRNRSGSRIPNLYGIFESFSRDSFLSRKYYNCYRIVCDIFGYKKGRITNFMYRRPTLYPLEIAVDFLKSP